MSRSSPGSTRREPADPGSAPGSPTRAAGDIEGPRPRPERLRALRPMSEDVIASAVLKRDAEYRRLLAISDLLAVLVALAVAVGPGRLTWQSAAALPVAVFVAKLLGLYDRDELLLRKTTLEEAPRIFYFTALFALGFWLSSKPLLEVDLDRDSTVILWGTLLAAMVLGRTLARLVAAAVAPLERCLFIGGDDQARRFAGKLAQGRGIKAEIVARLEFDEAVRWAAADEEAETLKLVDVRSLVAEWDVHRVVLAPGSAGGAGTADLVRALKAAGIRVSLLPDLFEVVGSSVEFDDVHGLTVLGVRRFSLSRSSRLVKRAFDLAGTSIALVLLAPLMAVIALAIKLDSRGPLFFRQERVGKGGESFEMIKFRTMVPGAEGIKSTLRDRSDAATGFFKIEDDPRVTRVGRFLRRTSLDELPQLFNIVRGEMSLVGPRPLVPDEDDLIEGWQRHRLELTPGMTGHWQILGSSRIPMDEMVAIDYLYLANWSLWSDVKILLRTVPYVAARRSR